MYFFHLITLSSVLHTVRKGENVLCGFYPKLLGIYLKRLTEETVLSDKTQKMVDNDLHGSYSRVKRIWVSSSVGIKGEHCMKKMQLHLKNAVHLLKPRIPPSAAVTSGGKCTMEGICPQPPPLWPPLLPLSPLSSFACSSHHPECSFSALQL